MGGWGVYDDESDSSCDNLYHFVEYLGLNDNDERTVLLAYNQGNLWDGYKQFITEKEIEGKIGLMLHILKTVGGDELQNPPMYGIPGASSLPSNLPSDFPGDLKSIMIDEIRKSIESLNEGDEWGGDERRMDALNHELYLFSKGEQGEDGNGKIVQNRFQEFFGAQKE